MAGLASTPSGSDSGLYMPPHVQRRSTGSPEGGGLQSKASQTTTLQSCLPLTVQEETIFHHVPGTAILGKKKNSALSKILDSRTSILITLVLWKADSEKIEISQPLS